LTAASAADSQPYRSVDLLSRVRTPDGNDQHRWQRRDSGRRHRWPALTDAGAGDGGAKRRNRRAAAAQSGRTRARQRPRAGGHTRGAVQGGETPVKLEP
jgi:hypothetical protein